MPRLAVCWAHAWRKFHDIHVATKSSIANEALQRIAALCAVEADIRGLPAEQRLSVRQRDSHPVVEAMHIWLTESMARVSGRPKLAKAMRYALSHWAGLIGFLDDRRLELDTNTVERAICRAALGRKDTLFAGSAVGGKHWAIIRSLIQTAQRDGFDPLARLTDELKRNVSGQTKQSQLVTLLPRNWKMDNAAAALIA